MIIIHVLVAFGLFWFAAALANFRDKSCLLGCIPPVIFAVAVVIGWFLPSDYLRALFGEIVAAVMIAALLFRREVPDRLRASDKARRKHIRRNIWLSIRGRPLEPSDPSKIEYRREGKPAEMPFAHYGPDGEPEDTGKIDVEYDPDGPDYSEDKPIDIEDLIDDEDYDGGVTF